MGDNLKREDIIDLVYKISEDDLELLYIFMKRLSKDCKCYLKKDVYKNTAEDSQPLKTISKVKIPIENESEEYSDDFSENVPPEYEDSSDEELKKFLGDDYLERMMLWKVD
ncbi:hypothetical protein HMPREF0629_00231 [Peptoniphilus sp. oral taxon 386 str. F0131]|nr:hypothetical protein HMPREF0629_00231 [Peptoniphilus sp. oral taxon 386 str. F0131]